MAYKQKTNHIRKEIEEDVKHLDLLGLVRTILLCFIIFFSFLKVISRPVYVSGDSMYPTLKNQDIGVSNVLSVYIGSIDRFDIVMVYDEVEGTSIIKRVIGLPNDTVQYRDEVLYINNQPVEEYFLDKEYMNEQTNNGKVKFTDDYGPITLKEGEYFLMGDNRRISKDSRAVGPVPTESIVSKGIFILYPW